MEYFLIAAQTLAHQNEKKDERTDEKKNQAERVVCWLTALLRVLDVVVGIQTAHKGRCVCVRWCSSLQHFHPHSASASCDFAHDI